MSRAIDADALEELFREVIGGIAKKPEMNGNLEHMVRASAMVIEMIQDAPTIEPERKKGRWIPLQLSIAYPPYQCSCCFRNAPMIETGCLMNRHLEALLTDFCPNCGAEMREPEDIPMEYFESGGR